MKTREWAVPLLAVAAVAPSVLGGRLRADSASANVTSSEHRSGASNVTLVSDDGACACGADSEHESTSHVEVVNDLGAPCDALTYELRFGVCKGKFCIPSGTLSKPAPKNIAAGKPWEPATHLGIDKYYQAQESKGDLVTAGLFFGDFLPHLSRAAGATNRVWGFEPNRVNFEAARGTVHMNSIDNVWMARAGLGAASGGSFDLCVARASGSLGGQSHEVGNAGEIQNATCIVETVPVVAIDDVVPLERRASVIHLDVEGHEVACLQGAKNTIQRWRPLVIVEDGVRRTGGQSQRVVPGAQSFLAAMNYQAPVAVENNVFFYP